VTLVLVPITHLAISLAAPLVEAAKIVSPVEITPAVVVAVAIVLPPGPKLATLEAT